MGLSMRADPTLRRSHTTQPGDLETSNEGASWDVISPIPSKAFILEYFLNNESKLGPQASSNLAGDTLDPGLRKVNGLELSQQ